MTATPSKSLALALLVLGIILTLAGTLATLAAGQRRLFLLFAAGCALQLAAWYRHGRRAGGAA